MKNKIYFLILSFLTCIMCCVSCQNKSFFTSRFNENDTEALRSNFREYFRENYVADYLIQNGNAEIHVFYCDVDGDGVEEAFAVSYSDCDRSGYFWKVFRFENNEWLSMSTCLDSYSYLSDSALSFYYRDDITEQPRLFIDKIVTHSPLAVVITKDNQIISVPFDRRDYEKLREEGKLKPIESAWYTIDDKIRLSCCPLTYKDTYILKGQDKLVGPYECYGDFTGEEELYDFIDEFKQRYESKIAKCVDTNAFCIFEFDVDGDYLNERFITCDAMSSKSGSEWHVFRGQFDDWREVRMEYGKSHLRAPASRFYYREFNSYLDDLREQPRLFVDTCITNNPLVISYDVYKHLQIDEFDRIKFENMREKGLLKPVESRWFNIGNFNDIPGFDMRTIKGNNKPINPDDEFPYDDLIPSGNIRLKNSDSTNALGQEVCVLEDEYIPPKRENKNLTTDEDNILPSTELSSLRDSSNLLIFFFYRAFIPTGFF